MQRTIAVVALTLLTVTAGCGAFPSASNPAGNVQSPAQANQASSGTGQTVAVSASGRVETAPDQAVIRMTVAARADSAAAVRDQLAANASQLQTALQDAGLAADQIVSTEFDIGRNYERRDRPSAPKFRGEHTFTVTVNETDRAGEIIVTAVENGATEIESVRFTITPETRRELRQQALGQAVENAHGKAQVAANGTNLALAGVRTVQTTDVSTEPIRREDVAFAAAAQSGGASTSLEGGKVTVTAQVIVVYNATQTRAD